MVLSESIKQKVVEKWQQAFEIADKLTSQKAIDSENGEMKYHHTKQLVDVYELKGDSTTVIRGDVIVDDLENSNEFIEYFTSLDMNIATKLDPNSKRVDLLEEWKDDDGSKWRICYYCISAGAPFVSDRDFIYVVKFFTRDNVDYFVSTSCDEIYEPPSDFKPQKGAVRATNIFVAQRYEKISEKSYLVTYANQAKPNGWIPVAVVNSAIYPVPLTMVKVADFLGKKVRVPTNSPSLKK